MKRVGWILSMFASVALASTAHGSTLESLHASCSISASEQPGMFRLRIENKDCRNEEHCGSSEFSDDSLRHLTGVSLSDLGREGAQLTATISAEAGTFTCAGHVHESVLRGAATFTPNEAFVRQMDGMGFSGLDSRKLQAYTLFDISTEWVQSLQKAGIGGVNVDNLIGMRIFKVDASYVADLEALGYKTPAADKLIGLKVQGVNADEVRQIRALGLQPSLDELIQIKIFHITPDFIRRMQGRGLPDLTIAKLVQIKIFKLDE